MLDIPMGLVPDAKYDLSAKLSTTSRTFKRQLADGWVLFNPDWPGQPIVVSGDAHALLERFGNGECVGDVLAQVSGKISLSEGLELIGEYEDRGFLRSAPTPSRYSAFEVPAHPPNGLSIWIHINNHCNLDCSYCFVDKFKASMTDGVIDETIRTIRQTIVSKSIKSVQIKFAGGEPTLSMEGIETFYDKLLTSMADIPVRFDFGIISNGTVVTDRLVSFLSRTKTGIAISLDGFGAEGHDIYRVYKTSRQGSWRKIYDNIQRLTSKGIRPSFNVTVSEESCSTLPALARWMVEQQFRVRVSVVRQPSSHFSKNLPIAAQFKRMTGALNDAFEEMFKILEDDQYEIDVDNYLSLCELHFEHPSFTTCCGIGHSHIVIQEDGRIASCPMTIREMNVQKNSGDLVEAARKTIAHWNPSDRNNQKSNCLDCNWFPVCVGGCPVNNERVKGDPFTISPLHDFYQYVIPRYVVFYGRKLLQCARRQSDGDFLLLTGAASSYTS